MVKNTHYPQTPTSAHCTRGPSVGTSVCASTKLPTRVTEEPSGLSTTGEEGASRLELPPGSSPLEGMCSVDAKQRNVSPLFFSFELVFKEPIGLAGCLRVEGS